MTPAPGPHLSPDEVDAWLAGALDADSQRATSSCARSASSAPRPSGRSSSSSPPCR